MYKFILLGFFLFSIHIAGAQRSLGGLDLSADSLTINRFLDKDRKEIRTGYTSLPLLSYILNEKEYTSPAKFTNSIKIDVSEYKETVKGVRATILFFNSGKDTVRIKNVVPFGTGSDRVFITGKGDHGLSRTHLFIPGKLPVNVIVPDNAWDLGFTTISADPNMQVTALVRRNRASIKNGTRTRFETILYPGGSVEYSYFSESVPGNWRNALRHVFQERKLYDVDEFDNSLFEREDLKWIRHTYVHHLMMTWDKYYYDIADRKFHLQEFLERGNKLYGGDDVVSIWPTWPTLGLDQRNQFDMFRDLPGGTQQIKNLAAMSRRDSTRFFICYNPWDESTRSEDHFMGLSDLIKATSADGVILDTRGGSSKELQDAADRVRKGVIMYSEGMAVPADMQGIVSGRVHNALYYPPMLNLNKLIKPDFTIYRVAELFKEPILREFNTSFFNGYGTEMNIMAPGAPDFAEEQYRYLGKTSRILRENTYNFVSENYTPLINTTTDSIWVNEWPGDQKTIYTVYGIRPQGYKGLLFEVKPEEGFHFVDLWNHRLLKPVDSSGKTLIEVETGSFNQKYLGTNNEGAVTAIARLPVLLETSLSIDKLELKSKPAGDEIRVWMGHPSYEKQPLVLKPGNHSLNLGKTFGRFEGDIIIQLMKKGILIDETIVTLKAGMPKRISETVKTVPSSRIPDGMVLIPPGAFTFKATNGDEFIPYPKQEAGMKFELPAFYMDKFPVTNEQYRQFVMKSGYKPKDTSNYLKHWNKGKMPPGVSDKPVVYISYEDAQAYARWTGKRLPTEIEWQYAAQTPELNEWPWIQKTPVTRKLQEVTNTLTVSTIEGIDSSMCNLGDGILHPVGSYPLGVNPYGLHDLVGSVWQLTNDVYMLGNYRYILMKGGSYFKPSSSWWYVQGGPRELHYRQFLLRVSEGFERNGTVGFRCVKEKGN